ncbi:MAG: FCD domain-containing protein [Eubacteriales bacterium]|nr:FCD domain-containing protein [Eubacteriales bacterium]
MREKEAGNLKQSFINRIVGQILSGTLKPGDRLLPERELAACCGISRGSVNQGILDLERMGFLSIVPRKGTFVSDYLKNATPSTVSAIMSYDSDYISGALFRDLMELRILVERECVRLSCARINDRNTALLREKNGAIYSASDSELADAVYDYHRCITEISGNAAYAMIFRSFEKMMRRLIRIHFEDREEAKGCIGRYSDLTASIAAGNCEAADREISEILGRASVYLNTLLAEKDGSND